MTAPDCCSASTRAPPPSRRRFSTSGLQPVREARREKASSIPRPGWVEQDAEEVLDAVVDAVAEVLDGAPR